MTSTLSVSGGLIVAIGGSPSRPRHRPYRHEGHGSHRKDPEASGRILPAMILAMAFAEAIAIYSLIFAFLH